MPKLWNTTIEAHRREVRAAILDTTAALVSEYGLRSVTMSRIAEETGIGRATLYKYFPDIEAILFAWHERQIASHLIHLSAVRDQARDPRARLEAVLTAYARIHREHIQQHHRESHGTDVVTILHQGKHVIRAQEELRDLIRDLLTEAEGTGDVRNDATPDELVTYCLHALAAASSLPSEAAVDRLVSIVLSGLRPSP
jgi:AcrR family transcriptional regulator